MPTDTSQGLAVQKVASGFNNPVYLTAPAGDGRLFVVEQIGRIQIVQNGQTLGTPFLDITAKVQNGGERGLLSMAFHPQYATNGYFYVDYTDGSGDTQVERYTVSANPNLADGASAVLILSVQQPYANHNGGMVQFGPDGMLYVGLGDGGSGGDPQGNGQNRSSLLGALLRLDVDGGSPYAIPADNPFVGQGGARGEIWAYGLRNPWRFAFDPPSGMLIIADVGQNAWEEIDVVPATSGGRNFGWNVMEGAHCYGQASCNQSGLTLPVLEYPTTGSTCSVIGGFVYRGSAIPTVDGTYFYSDWCGGFLRGFRLNNGMVTGQTEWSIDDIGQVLSFGQDAQNELYILGQNGFVYRIVGQP